ncbi:MAG TPA: gluconokinase [Anaerolineae bacterium]
MIIIVMGVSGSGKTTVGRLLAQRLGWPFYDGDDFHPAANIAKMRSGIPLTDEDRANWLTTLADLLRSLIADGRSAVLACSALRRAYRDQLRVASTAVQFVYLKGSYDLIVERMSSRSTHYMKPNMLASQFAALEEPRGDALTVDITLPPEEIVDQVVRALGRLPRPDLQSW